MQAVLFDLDGLVIKKHDYFSHKLGLKKSVDELLEYWLGFESNTETSPWLVPSKLAYKPGSTAITSIFSRF